MKEFLICNKNKSEDSTNYKENKFEDSINDNEKFYYYLKIYSLLEDFKILYLNMDKKILKLLFCLIFFGKKKFFNIPLIENIFENKFFKSEFYGEIYKNFILNNIYPIMINLLKNDFINLDKKLLKYYNTLEMGPLFYLIEILCENKFKKAEKIYPFIKIWIDKNDENIYIDTILLLMSNRTVDKNIIEKIFLFFNNNVKIDKNIFKELFKNQEQFLTYDKTYFKITENYFYIYDPLIKTYKQQHFNYLFLESNIIIYYRFCILEEMFDKDLSEKMFDKISLIELLMKKQRLR